jgi:ubiquinone/menaquinone biosynthesis C-methylase UbiE
MNLSTTQQYYILHASQYFDATYSLNLTSLWMKLLSQVLPGSTILDLGCGSGRDVAHFARRGLCSIGLDYSFPLLEQARAITKQPLTVGSFNNMPFIDSSFDAVWSIASLLHVPKAELGSVLDEISRLLKPGGILLTSIKMGVGEKPDHLGRFVAYYQPDEWRSVLDQAGFQIINIDVTREIKEVDVSNSGCVRWIECLARKGLR